MKEKLMEKIAGVKGIRPADCRLDEVARLLTIDERRNKDQHLPEYVKLVTKYVLDENSPLIKYQSRFERLIFERLVRLRQYHDAIHGVQKQSFYGQNAVSYLFGLAQMRKEGTLPTGSRSLLVGAITRDTLEQFVKTTRLIDHQAETYCVDIAGEETRIPDTFVLGDGFKLPFRDGAFDTVQTHRLIDYLQVMAEDGSRSAFDPKDFFREVFRVLKPGGGFLRIEGTHAQPEELVQSGFDIQAIHHSHIFKDDLTAYQFFDDGILFFTKGGDSLKAACRVGKDAFILARKPLTQAHPTRQTEKVWVNDGKTTW